VSQAIRFTMFGGTWFGIRTLHLQKFSSFLTTNANLTLTNLQDLSQLFTHSSTKSITQTQTKANATHKFIQVIKYIIYEMLVQSRRHGISSSTFLCLTSMLNGRSTATNRQCINPSTHSSAHSTRNSQHLRKFTRIHKKVRTSQRLRKGPIRTQDPKDQSKHKLHIVPTFTKLTKLQNAKRLYCILAHNWARPHAQLSHVQMKTNIQIRYVNS